MALEPAPELVQAHIDFAAAIQRHDVDALGEMISTHPATTARGTQPGAVVRGRDALLAALATVDTEEGESLVDTHVEAFADGDLGYVYADAVWTSPDGTTFPIRGLVVAHREGGRWRYLHGLNAIPVPDEILTSGSPLAIAPGSGES